MDRLPVNLRSLTGASPQYLLSVLRGGPGEVPVQAAGPVGCRIGEKGGQRLGFWGGKLGLEGSAKGGRQATTYWKVSRVSIPHAGRLQGASTVTRKLSYIMTTKFTISILAGELPVNAPALRIAPLLPSGHFAGQELGAA